MTNDPVATIGGESNLVMRFFRNTNDRHETCQAPPGHHTFFRRYMATSFLDYYKTLLTKVSFDRNLFIKEFNKAMKMLDAESRMHLQQWLSNKGLILDLEVNAQTRGDKTVSANSR